MAENSKIEWTDHTFNPWIGCQAVSPGCDHCYAEALAKRTGRDFATRTRTSEANWKLPLKWDRQAKAEGRRFRVFCASMADVFDNQAPDEWRADLFALIQATPHLDWLLLTKRIGNVASMLPPAALQPMSPHHPYPNIRIGATITSQPEADRDVCKLLQLPLPNFLSMEPLLGAVDLTELQPPGELRMWVDALRGTASSLGGTGPLHHIRRVDWVIVGGESGHGARPMHPNWARSLRDQCAAAGVPFLFKQWGEWEPLHTLERYQGRTVYDFEDWQQMRRVGKKAAGRELDGRTHDGFPGGAP